ncbi:MAG TPA: hypothetical protein VNK26_08590 [Pyrinomonadaceae bacterium]|nr:hypothetical protein [Pyrinomonadaceae bacterium]
MQSQFILAQRDVPISAVQGEKNISPLVGELVRVSGIVTGRTNNGFFIQTPDSRIDSNPLTSEGIFVFTKDLPYPEAQPGNEVILTGRVDEFRPRAEPAGLTVTEISHFKGRDTFGVISKNNPLPKPVEITLADFQSNSVDQLEKYEGMRIVLPEAYVVGPSGGRVDPVNETVTPDGVFYAALKGIPRPFREPGLDIMLYLASNDKDKWKKQFPKLPIYDGNPEVLRVDADALAPGRLVEVMSGASLKNLSGIVHYAFNRYTIYLDPIYQYDSKTVIAPLPLPPPSKNQFSIASSNIESFFDDVDDPDIKEEVLTAEAFNKRLGKVSSAVIRYLNLPDILAVLEAENLNVLKKLAEKINSEEVKAGRPDPKYAPFLIEGNDPRGIDNGFLVKTSRVNVKSIKQFGKNETIRDPETGKDVPLNDRPPLLLEAEIPTETGQPVAFTVIANHLKSYRGNDDPRTADFVRTKRRMQAEYLAKLVNQRQKENPNERIVLVGDFNAFQFSDGIVDIIGTIKGQPAPLDAVLIPTEDLVESDLTDLVDLIKPEQQYSYIFDGSAQVLDHILINTRMKQLLAGFGYLRINADYPQIIRANPAVAIRYSDHDPAVAYFSLKPPEM